MKITTDPILVGETLLLAEALCIRLDLRLGLDFAEHLAWGVEVATGQIVHTSYHRNSWLDALLLLIGKFKVELQVLKQGTS